VGIGLAGWSREAWDISRDDLLVAGLGGMEGLWTGLLLPEVTMLRRLEDICEKAGIDPVECWRRVRGDVDLAVRVRERIQK
jgi:hypothetical protein